MSESAEMDERFFPQEQRHKVIADACAEMLASARTGDLEGFVKSRAERIRSAATQGLPYRSMILTFLTMQEAMRPLLLRFYGSDPELLTRATGALNRAFSLIKAHEAEMYLAAKEEVIKAQQQAMLQLSTPVIQVWEGILVAPLVGTIDSERAMQITQNLLIMVRDTKASIAIIDISGVPMVDTLVANHLLKTVRAARLLGAKCLIVGISPEIAETLINLGVDLSGVDTFFSLHTGLKQAFRELGQAVGPA
ncbi:MAG: STAS domain-containing protein [Chloroflexi bacterium]|nr:STAS domain-containing protein [Chloroflexota bacterium]